VILDELGAFVPAGERGPLLAPFEALRALVNIQPVADYYFEGTDQEDWKPQEFPNVAPPWASFAVFFRFPRQIVSRVTGTKPHPWAGRAAACAFATQRLEGELKGWFLVSAVSFLGIPEVSWPVVSLTKFVVDPTGHIPSEAPPGVCPRDDLRAIGNWMRAVQKARGFASAERVPESDGLRTTEPVVTMPMAVLGSGRVGLRERTELLTRCSQGWVLHPALLAISFAHCKNVSMPEESLPPKVLRARARRGKAPGFTKWRTLRIEPMTRILRKHQERGASVKTALHICRGHFKDYREGPGLFGRVNGLWWWDMQVRGSRERGEVVKTYEVAPGAMGAGR